MSCRPQHALHDSSDHSSDQLRLLVKFGLCAYFLFCLTSVSRVSISVASLNSGASSGTLGGRGAGRWLGTGSDWWISAICAGSAPSAPRSAILGVWSSLLTSSLKSFFFLLFVSATGRAPGSAKASAWGRRRSAINVGVGTSTGAGAGAGLASSSFSDDVISRLAEGLGAGAEGAFLARGRSNWGLRARASGGV